MIRVLVVDDSTTVRRHLVEVLTAAEGFEVVGEAGDAASALALWEARRPDVVTLDMALPDQSGVTVTEHIMGHRPTPILVVSGSTNRGDLLHTCDALGAGAVDVLEKPAADEPPGAWERRFLAAVRIVSRIRVITHVRARLPSGPRPRPTARPGPGDAAPRLVVIGASTGGPGALAAVLRELPDTYDVPTAIVLHLGETFADAFVQWLAGQARRPVGWARAGEPLGGLTGRVVVAPPGRHLVVEGGRLGLSDAPELHGCRPSVDVLFSSAARALGATAAGCLLTGMGRDGAAGLLELRNAGAATIAQDEATSVVWGMPREAVRLGAAERVLPLSEIGRALGALGPKEAR